MKHLVVPVAVLAAAVVVAVSPASGAVAQTAAQRTATLHVVEKDVGFNFVDNPPRQGLESPPLLGDQFVFTSNVLTRAGKRAGVLDASCVVTRGGTRGESVCTGILGLAGGQLSVIARAPIADSNAPVHIAIVGGTGVYEGVTGSISSKSRGENSPFSDDTIHLIFPA